MGFCMPNMELLQIRFFYRIKFVTYIKLCQLRDSTQPSFTCSKVTIETRCENMFNILCYIYIYNAIKKYVIYIYIYNAIGDIYLYIIYVAYIYIYIYVTCTRSRRPSKISQIQIPARFHFSCIWERNGKVFGKNTVTFWQCCLYGQFIRSLLHMTIMTVAHWKFCARKYIKQHYLCWD